MKIRVMAAAVAALFIVGAGHAAEKLDRTAPAMYHGKSNQDAARQLLAAARVQAGKGSWEQIAVGRVYYLGGFKAEGQAIFDAILAGRPEDSDVYRIARVYREAGEWDKAKPLFERYFQSTSDDGAAYAEVGAYYLRAGDRAAAEKLFDSSVDIESKDLWSTLHMAGAYLDVDPQE
jgi:tetratricopeptide (TPR) repeat protein